MSGMIPLIAGAVGAFVLLYVVLDGIYAVNAAEIAVITRLGKFNRIRQIGHALEAFPREGGLPA